MTCNRCGRPTDDDETHCGPCREELAFWADVFTEVSDVGGDGE